MNEEKFLMFHNRLAKVFRHRRKLARAIALECYRIYDHDIPEFPVCIELYKDQLYVAEYKRQHSLSEEAHEQWMNRTREEIISVTGIPKENITIRLRQRKQGRLGQYQKLDEKAHEFIVEENGLKFIINLTDYLDTGLFLDHRITREMVRKTAEGKKMLNLFAYTGSFSVYAAAGGATRVDTIDMSRTYLSWAERNMKLNGFTDQEKFNYIPADVLQFLKLPPPIKYDIIVLDPPTFSNSQRMEDILDVQRDHVFMINACLRLLNPGGVIYFSTNFRKFQLEKERIKTTLVKDITRATTSFDFEGKFSRWCYEIRKG